ncbi:MAG: hypothetical protein WC628_04135 [Candidatus Omnitrophota bacterium]
MDKIFTKWNKWLDVIYKEITSLSVNRHIFWEVQEIIKSNKEIQKPSSFYEFLGSAYASLAVMGIRRQVKINKQSISFARLLKQIADNPGVVSRERYVALYGTDQMMREIGERDFKKFADKLGKRINSSVVINDLKSLQTKAAKCEKYADMRVAHFDKRALKNPPTFKDLDDCINHLEELLKKYLLIFRATCVSSVLPTWQYDWKEIFLAPWIVPDIKEV